MNRWHPSCSDSGMQVTFRRAGHPLPHEDRHMLAVTDIAPQRADRFAATLRTFREHARAIASGQAEGDAFTWFLACEYQWEMEQAGQWLVHSPASRLSDGDKATLGHFMASMPEVRKAILAGRQQATAQAEPSQSPGWVDWLTIAALPTWNSFTVRTAILLSQLGDAPGNDAQFAPCR